MVSEAAINLNSVRYPYCVDWRDTYIVDGEEYRSKYWAWVDSIDDVRRNKEWRFIPMTEDTGSMRLDSTRTNKQNADDLRKLSEVALKREDVINVNNVLAKLCGIVADMLEREK